MGAAHTSNPSARLRASRPMPAWMQVTRAGPPPPPPPQDEPPVDPDYEVIDFGNIGQIYSNTPMPSGPNKSGKRCDLCGSSAPAVRCVQCTQNFCLSCDHMYHRHPKRQAHIRKELQDSKVRPPLPPKGEAVPAPVPPPRRNKTGRPPPARPAAPPLHRDQEVKSPALLNSLKRALPSRPMPSPPYPPMPNGVPPSPLIQPPNMGPMDMHGHHGNAGASEWDLNRRARAGSFSNLAAPGFSPLMQAQSMAQLNSPCPSCHFHGTGPAMSPWNANDPWGTWGAMPPWQSQNFLNQPSGRRGSRRESMRRRRDTSSGSDEEDNRRSRRGGTRRSNVSPTPSRRGNVSPTPSRRSRAPPSDYESEEDERDRGWEDPKRRGSNISRRPSLVDVNRSPHRREEDTMSLSGRRFSHATMSRTQKERRFEQEQQMRDRRNTIDKIMYADDDRMLPRGGQRLSDSEESPHSHENKNSLRRKSSRRSEKNFDLGRRRASPARSYYNENPTDSPFDDEIAVNKSIDAEVHADVQNGLETDVPVEEEPETEWDPIPDFDWECEHCTFVNEPGSRVCGVCCKTNPKPKKHFDSPPVTKVAEQMKSMTLDRTGSSRRAQDRNQERQRSNENFDQRGPSKPFHKQESFQEKQPRQNEMYNDRVVENPYHDRQQRQSDMFNERVQEKQSTKAESHQERQQKQQDSYSSKRQSALQSDREPDRFQDTVKMPEKHARGTSPMTSKRAQDPNRLVEMRSSGVRTPDTKTSDSSSYSSRNVISKGTSPPPQSISTQTYEVPVTKLKRATSLADYSEWRAPQRTFSRQSLLSDTQSLPVTPPKGRSPERFPDLSVADARRESEPLQTRRRAGSQPPEYISTLVQKQVKQGLEMVKLLREAEEQKFSADDLAVALLHCEDGDPVAWLQQNWRNMIDTVVTLATNYGHERKENTVGTISASEARDALRIHDGNVWAAVTECVEQRQKKYAELLSRGNFSREDIVTVLTANHGNLEAAYTELSKSQLKPFLMKIWGPPQGVDNESGNFTKLAHDESKGMGRGGVEQEEVSFNDFNRDRVQTWIDNSVSRSKLSQSMLHLNLIGNNNVNKALEKLEALSNLSKAEKRDLRARRTSDVHRYLTQFYALNDNSLKISKNFTSMQDVNKPQKENTNSLWKFLEKQLGLNSFASSGTLLTTVSTTSSNVQTKSINDFDSDSLNEGRSGEGVASVKSEVDGQLGDDFVDIEIDVEQNQDEEQHDGDNDDTIADEGVVEPRIAEVQELVPSDREQSISPMRQLFVKSITVSSEGSRRSASPLTVDVKPENDSEEDSSEESTSFESVEEDDAPNDRHEVDVNLDKNNESKEVAVLGKMILVEETPALDLNKRQDNDSKSDRENVDPQIEETRLMDDKDDENNKNEEELMQMVENLIQKTEFLQEEPTSDINKSISIMYTNKDTTLSDHSVPNSKNSSPLIPPLFKEETTMLNDAENEGKEAEELLKEVEDETVVLEDEQPEAIAAESQEVVIADEALKGEEHVQEPTEMDEAVETVTSNAGQTYTVTLDYNNSSDVHDKTNDYEAAIDGTSEPTMRSDEDENGDNEVFEEPLDIIELEPDENTNRIPEDGGISLAAADLNTEPKNVHPAEEVMANDIFESPGGEGDSQQLPANPGSSSGTPQTALNVAETDSKSIATNLLPMSEGNSERDVSPIPTDSERDTGSRFQEEVHKLSRAKSSYELNIGDNLVEKHAKLVRTASSHELVNLLRESLAKDDVVERIVSTLFQTVLRANEFQLPGRSRDPSLYPKSRNGSSLSRELSYRGSSASERDDSELFYEAVEPREIPSERRSRRHFKKRGRNSRRRGGGSTPRRTDDSSIVSTSTDNYSIHDDHSRSASPAEIVEDMDETEREARRLLAEGLVTSYDQAELAAQLRKLNFSEADSVLASKECASMDAAVAFLQQDCDLCAGKYCMKQMVSMLECEHMCCKECAQNYFTLQITERSVNDCVCPFCKEPDVSRLEEDTASDYFAHLDIFLKALVNENTHELFQRKLRDRTLMSDPHFKWCIKCSSGFIANPKQRKLICPDCRTITCAQCRRPWEKEHEKMTCEEFAAFKNEGDQDNQVEKHLAEDGVTCPKCHQRYLLAKGGCMHLTCPHCKHEFCSGCGKPFLMGSKCQLTSNCERLGLHSHHPRNCLFYLRDKDPPLLEQLLQEHGIQLNKDTNPSTSKCQTQLLKETTDGLVEASCGHPIEGAGLCRTHYIEHLVDLVKSNKIDPVGVMDATDAVQELRRHGKDLPMRADYESDKDYLNDCIKIISREIPLE